MQSLRIALLAPLLAMPLGACDCGEQLQVLAPIAEVADPYDQSFSVCADDFVRDCAYDFGEVGIGREKRLSFVIRNPSPVTLNVESITLEGSPNFTFEGELPDAVEKGLGPTGKLVTVKYVPTAETDETATITIVTDAQNLEPGEDIVIQLSGRGKDLGAPVIVVTPERCDFGDVGVNVRAFCDLSIANTGNLELAVTGVSFTAGTPAPDVFGAEGAFIIPTYVAPGTAVSARFYAVPNTTGSITGGLLIENTDPNTPVVEVPFDVRGAQSPTAVARVKSINGVANASAAPATEPLDHVIISGDQSVGENGASITGYAWEIIEKPAESSVTLSNPQAMDTGFRFSSAAGTVNGIDVAGTFVIRLTVTDDNGAVSQNDARVTLNSVPTGGLHVQLTWSSSQSDIDLHLARGNSPDWNSSGDCYYLNCRNGLNWDNDPVRGSAGDPILDIDDLSGYGPENINIESPVNGAYVIGVEAYRLDEPTDITVKVFMGGALVNEFNAFLSGNKEFWTVARVEVNGAANVTAIDTISPRIP